MPSILATNVAAVKSLAGKLGGSIKSLLGTELPDALGALRSGAGTAAAGAGAAVGVSAAATGIMALWPARAGLWMIRQPVDALRWGFRKAPMTAGLLTAGAGIATLAGVTSWVAGKARDRAAGQTELDAMVRMQQAQELAAAAQQRGAYMNSASPAEVAAMEARFRDSAQGQSADFAAAVKASAAQGPSSAPTV